MLGEENEVFSFLNNFVILKAILIGAIMSNGIPNACGVGIVSDF